MRGLPYVGGKSVSSPAGVGRWVVGLLPPVERGQTYVEPCAGMLGVLLQRPKAAIEIVNDINGHVVAWWQAVRDHPGELERRLSLTPRSRVVWQQAHEVLAAAEAGEQVAPVDHGWAAAVAVAQSFNRDLRKSSGWLIGPRTGIAARVPLLFARLRDVHLERRTAESVLERYAPDPGAVIYVDPPYPSSAHTQVGAYQHGVDAGRVLRAVSGAAARIAISGVASDPWAALEADGWRRSEFRRAVFLSGRSAGAESGRITEVLWMNYAPLGQLGMFG